MKKQNILLLGASLESDNRGVNALGVGAITVLKNNFKDSNVSIICVGPPCEKEIEVKISGEDLTMKLYYFSKYDVVKSIIEAYFNKILGVKPKLHISKLILESDIAFDINEGDSFSDIYGLKRIVRHFTDSKLILSWKKPLVFLPQTVGPFDTTTGKFLGKHILKRLKKLYVRDEKAFRFIDKIGVEKELAIDMAVYITPQETSFPVKPNTVGINVSGLMYLNRYKSLEGKYDNYVYFLENLVRRILNEGFEVLLVPHTYNANEPNEEDDLEGIKKFIKDFPELAKSITYVDKNYSAQQLKSIISKTVFFMGSRMHSCIAALSTSVPTIGLSYSYKFEGSFKMFKQQEMVLDVNYLEKDSVYSLIDEIIAGISKKETIKKVLLEENNRKQLSLDNIDD